MKIQIDTENKTITLMEKTSFQEISKIIGSLDGNIHEWSLFPQVVYRYGIQAEPFELKTPWTMEGSFGQTYTTTNPYNPDSVE